MMIHQPLTHTQLLRKYTSCRAYTTNIHVYDMYSVQVHIPLQQYTHVCVHTHTHA